MPSRRTLLKWAGLAGGLSALPATLRAKGAAMPPISESDFAADPARAVAAQSAAYDVERPFLFGGLAPRFATKIIHSCFIPMRDGVRLSTDFHIPVGATLPLPVILSRTPYNKISTGARGALSQIFPEQGFIFAAQDVRGRYESEGEFLACTGQDREDGYDTVSWLAAQSWCNGSVGAIGSSYVGETTAKLAAMRHPNHRASVIMFDGAYAGAGYRNGAFLQNGTAMLRSLFEWCRDLIPKISYGPPAWVDRQKWFRSAQAQAYSTQPVNLPRVDTERHIGTLPVDTLVDRAGGPPSDFGDMMRNGGDYASPYWANQRFLTEADQFDTPTLHLTGNEEMGGSGPHNFRLFRKNAVSQRTRDNQVLIFAASPHSGHARALEHTKRGLRDFGDTRYPYYKMFVDWFGHWLRGDETGVADWPKAHYFVTGRNEWETGDIWPPADSRTLKLYLHGSREARRGTLSTRPPKGALARTMFRYDPADPTPSDLVGADGTLIGIGFADRSTLEARTDLLAFTSAPLSAPVELAGPIRAVLSVSSSAKDTDFVAILLEVDAQGRAINVTQGSLRMRFHAGFDAPELLEPGRVYQAQIDMWFANIAFARGNRIRLHVASSHFPFFDRNLNTGGDNYTETDWVVAENAVHTDAAHPSYLELPVRGTAPTI